MNSRLIGDISIVSHIHDETHGSSRSCGLDFTLHHWINFNSHVVELNDLNLQLNLVSDLSTIIGFFAQYIEYNGVLACESHFRYGDEEGCGLRLAAVKLLEQYSGDIDIPYMRLSLRVSN